MRPGPVQWAAMVLICALVGVGVARMQAPRRPASEPQVQFASSEDVLLWYRAVKGPIEIPPGKYIFGETFKTEPPIPAARDTVRTVSVKRETVKVALTSEEMIERLEARTKAFVKWRGKYWDWLTPEQRESEMRDMALIWGR